MPQVKLLQQHSILLDEILLEISTWDNFEMKIYPSKNYPTSKNHMTGFCHILSCARFHPFENITLFTTVTLHVKSQQIIPLLINEISFLYGALYGGYNQI